MLPPGSLLPKIPASVTGHSSATHQGQLLESITGLGYRIIRAQSHLTNEGEEKRCKCSGKEDANKERKSSREDEEFERDYKVKLHSRFQEVFVCLLFVLCLFFAQREQEVSALSRKVNYSEDSQEVAWQEIHIDNHL